MRLFLASAAATTFLKGVPTLSQVIDDGLLLRLLMVHCLIVKGNRVFARAYLRSRCQRGFFSYQSRTSDHRCNSLGSCRWHCLKPMIAHLSSDGIWYVLRLLWSMVQGLSDAGIWLAFTEITSLPRSDRFDSIAGRRQCSSSFLRPDTFHAKRNEIFVKISLQFQICSCTT